MIDIYYVFIYNLGLGRDQWHRASVSLDLHRMELSATLDLGDPDSHRSLLLKGHNVTTAAGQRLTSVISVGGQSKLAILIQRIF